MKHYLSICAIFRDEAPYLEEWVEFHRLVGVERFFLYDNMSTDDHAEVLEPYVREGSVVVHPWTEHPGQGGAYEHCLDTYRSESRWIAFIDLDEYLFSPLRRPLPELLAEYERWPGVGVNRHTFGSSGHKNDAGRTCRSRTTSCGGRWCRIKSIVDPGRTLGHRNPHAFVYRDGEFAVDEHGQPIDGWFTNEFTAERLRINHYYTRSEAEFGRKLSQERADNATMREEPPNWDRLSGRERDDAITAYGPALREALARRAAGRG